MKISNTIQTVTVKQGREKSLRRCHLWVYSGAIESSIEAQAGSTVKLCSSNGEFLAYGAWSPSSEIRVKVWSFNEKEIIDRNFFKKRIANAISLREKLNFISKESSCRLIHAEGDSLPGVIVDKYGEFLCLQLSSCGAEYHRNDIIEELALQTNCKGIFERSDVDVRHKENLQFKSGCVYGENPPNPLIIKENDLRFAVDLRRGQKTGFYFDQRNSRQAICKYVKDKKVLNVFSYTGAFALTALANGATHVTNIDSSESSLALCKHNLEMNKFKPNQYENRCADAFQELRKLVDSKAKFDVVILDPPKFIDSQRVLFKGARAYQDIARLGYQLLNEGGILVNFSCSGLMNAELFQKITADAALDAKVDAVLLERLSQSQDHLISLSVPEGAYLKGLISEVREKF